MRRGRITGTSWVGSPFHLLDARTEEQLDVALLEYCDFLYLNSEDSSFGQSSRRL